MTHATLPAEFSTSLLLPHTLSESLSCELLHQISMTATVGSLCTFQVTPSS
eukprot:m.650080 g.650080  ORF g.650080 m.650080 type:complete len:51 (+) comp22668_c0_seq2:3406-3558(+)